MNEDKIAVEKTSAHEGIVRHGFGLKPAITAGLNEDYYSEIIESLRAGDHTLTAGGLRLRLAKAFGFCYGVDKAIDFAYETRCKFPERRIFLTNEIIHNPRVNRRLVEMGVRILTGQHADGATFDEIHAEDVVLLPAFGVDAALLARLQAIGCLLVDTTCGSVVHVWKRVEKYARDGFTAVIHGKWAHEETVATCSRVTHAGGHYLVVRDETEARGVCDFIRSGAGATTMTALEARFDRASSPGFDFARHLERIGCANQTTMLSTESLAIAEMIREALAERHGEAAIGEHFRSFDTICNATQERQDAVMELMREPPDLMLVVGGFNSSNTGHLCEIAAQYCPTYHVDEAARLVSPDEIHHRPPEQAGATGAGTKGAGGKGVVGLTVTRGWLPTRRPLEIGLTAGASTPNRVIGEVIERLIEWERE